MTYGDILLKVRIFGEKFVNKPRFRPVKEEGIGLNWTESIKRDPLKQKLPHICTRGYKNQLSTDGPLEKLHRRLKVDLGCMLQLRNRLLHYVGCDHCVDITNRVGSKQGGINSWYLREQRDRIVIYIYICIIGQV